MQKFTKTKLEDVNENTVQYRVNGGVARWHKRQKFAVVTRVKGRFDCNSVDEFKEIIKSKLLTQ